MAATFTPIATVTVGSGGSLTMEFTNIPQTYTDLLIKVSARDNVDGQPDSLKIGFNGSVANRTIRYLDGNGSAASSDNTDNISSVMVPSGATANTFGNAEFYIPNYAGSNNKSVSADGVAETNASEAWMRLSAGLWSQTAAITSIKLEAGNQNFVQYSSATLYGIKNG